MWSRLPVRGLRMSVAQLMPRVAHTCKPLTVVNGPGPNRASLHTCAQVSLHNPTSPVVLFSIPPCTPVTTTSRASRFQLPAVPRSSLNPSPQLTSPPSTAGDLPANLQKIVEGFQSVSDPRARYQQLLFYASKLKPLPDEHRTTDNKVVGCVSQVWVLPSIDSGSGRVSFQADSDSALTKGLAALLVEGLSGSYPSEILKITPEFVQLLGLKQSLTPSRNNGFLNMLKLMQKKTLALYMQSEAQKQAAGSGAVVAEAAAAGAASGSDDVAQATDQGTGGSSGDVPRGGDDAGPTLTGRPIYDGMKSKLEAGLAPAEVDVDDVSHQHAGHAGVAKGSSETHFNVKIVSSSFEGLTTVKRHRLVYSLLKEEFANGLHALSLVTKTPAEIQAS